MARNHKPEEIIGKLREAEIVLAQVTGPRRRTRSNQPDSAVQNVIGNSTGQAWCAVSSIRNLANRSAAAAGASSVGKCPQWGSA